MSTENRTVKGLLGKKLGMTQAWDENNKMIPITVVEAGSNVVTQIKNLEVDGYQAVQVAYGAIAARKVNKPEAGHFAKASVAPRRFLAEIRTADADTYSVGQELGVEVFEVGQMLDVVGTSKGKGFAGHMKRHGFHGGPNTHGNTKHRKPGSIGAGTDPSRVIKGKKMPGQYGNVQHTSLSIRVEKVDAERNLIYLRGSVAGPTNGIVFVRKQG
jgi:large subunit ribosomal protein L3